ncbi:carbon starvation CstA family protein [Limnochorda pilosa]|uniref:carbon starvation CstA family protein n=1 Tax=Limnochorda pilosa TaxID=1555112 RepID=UPI000832F21F|nr:carbon starvation protein A [Limnochorda pilosa]
MTTWLLLLGLVLYVVAYLTYGRGLSRSVVHTDDSRQTPAHTLYDGVDYVPGNPLAIYGHHFASIAGAGPITGPAIAMIWGWLPSLIWIWLGNIVIGAVHDYLAVMASVRSEGKSIQWIAGKTMKPRTSRIMMVFIYATLVLVVAAFVTVAGLNFVATPGVASASMLFLVAALVFGVLSYRMKVNFTLATVIGLVLLAGAIWLGFVWGWHASFQTWVVVLAIYAVLASSLPVWLLLQPRDYLNSYILFVGLGAGIIALLAAFKGMALPAYSVWSASAVGGVSSPFWPAIPLVIACGSLSGFHSLVGSGTTSKQLDKESHGLPIGYGGMLTEGVLATVVVLAMGAYGFQVLGTVSGQLADAGISLARLETDAAYYGSTFLKAANPVGGALGLFTRSYGLALSDVFGVTAQFGTLFAGLWVTAFVLTTLDTATRLARFTWQEFFGYLKESSPGVHRVITDRWVAGAIVVILAGWLSWGGAYTVVWPAFAGANQMVAAVAMLTAALWAIKIQKASSGYQWATVIPGAFLWVTVFAGLIWYVYAVPATLVIKAIFVLMAVLSLLLLVDFFDGYRRRVQAPVGVAGSGR